MANPYGKTVGGLLSDYAGGIFKTNPNAMTLLPLQVSDKGDVGIAMPQIVPAIANELYDAFTLPGDVYSGKREANAEEALRFTGALAGGSLLAPVPKNALRMFGGPSAKTANKPALKKAQEMELDGFSENEIIAQTGWFRGADNKWRFEIDDTEASIGRFPTEKQLNNRSSIKQTLTHDKLFEAYPELADIPLRPGYGGSFKGSFRPGADGEKDKILVGVLANKMTAYPALTAGARQEAKEGMTSTLLHELQHAIQRRENFARGGNPGEFVDEAVKATDSIPAINKRLSEASREIEAAEKDVLKAVGVVETALAREKVNGLKEVYQSILEQKEEAVSKMDPLGRYFNQAGEVEARNVQARIDMTPNERASIIPRTTEDRARSAQEIRLNKDDIMSEYDKINYRGSHRPVGPTDENPIRLDDLTKTVDGDTAGYPDDFYGPSGPRIYAPRRRFDDDEYGIANEQSYDIISRVRGNPDAEVTIYRAVPNEDSISSINQGDFVTLSPKYAELHAGSGYGPRGDEAGKVLSQKVKVKDVYFAGDDVNEFGYFPSQSKPSEIEVRVERAKEEYFSNPNDEVSRNRYLELRRQRDQVEGVMSEYDKIVRGEID